MAFCGKHREQELAFEKVWSITVDFFKEVLNTRAENVQPFKISFKVP